MNCWERFREISHHKAASTVGKKGVKEELPKDGFMANNIKFKKKLNDCAKAMKIMAILRPYLYFFFLFENFNF